MQTSWPPEAIKRSWVAEAVLSWGVGMTRRLWPWGVGWNGKGRGPKVGTSTGSGEDRGT